MVGHMEVAEEESYHLKENDLMHFRHQYIFLQVPNQNTPVGHYVMQRNQSFKCC